MKTREINSFTLAGVLFVVGYCFAGSHVSCGADDDPLCEAAQKQMHYKQNRASWDSEWIESADFKANWISLAEFLNESGIKLNCSFTIEHLSDTADFESALELGGAFVPRQDVHSTEDLIKKLRNDLECVTIISTPGNTSIVRLIESRLLNLKNYPLEQQVTLTYSGSIEGLGEAIEKKVLNVGPARMSLIPPIGGGLRTRIEIVAVNQPIRNLLLEAIPVKNRPMLWEATTRNVGKDPFTELFFFEALGDDSEYSSKRQ